MQARWSPLRREPEAPSSNVTSRLHPALTSLRPVLMSLHPAFMSGTANTGHAAARVQGADYVALPPAEAGGLQVAGFKLIDCEY
jgi:hypothetical protein